MLHSLKIQLKKESGISQLLMLLLIAAGIGIGTFLVQQRTNLTPHAQSQEIIEVDEKNDVAIQAALDQVKATGGAVYLPAGTYLIKKKIRLFSNTTLFGDGIDKTILQLDESLLAHEDGIIGNDTNYGHKNIVLRDMTLRGVGKESGATACCPGIKLRQLDGGFFYNIKVEKFSWHGIWLVYKKQIRDETLDAVKNVRFSNCQVLDNMGSGIALDSPSSQNIVDNCTISGNNSGKDEDKYGGAGISLFMDEDGVVQKNRLINNRVINNHYRGISVVARNGITIAQKLIPDNAACGNTVENNKDSGIADGNSEDSYYYGNKISGNGKGPTGRVHTGALRYYDQSINEWFTTSQNSSVNMHEDETPGATSNDCKIPDKLKNLPEFALGSGSSPSPSGTVKPSSSGSKTASPSSSSGNGGNQGGDGGWFTGGGEGNPIRSIITRMTWFIGAAVDVVTD